MGIFSGPDPAPVAPPPTPEPLPEPPTEVDEGVQKARRDRQRIAASAGNRRSTILTDPAGLNEQEIQRRGKTILGR